MPPLGTAPQHPQHPHIPNPLLPLAPSGARGRSGIRAPSQPKPPVGLNCRSWVSPSLFLFANGRRQWLSHFLHLCKRLGLFKRRHGAGAGAAACGPAQSRRRTEGLRGGRPRPRCRELSALPGGRSGGSAGERRGRARAGRVAFVRRSSPAPARQRRRRPRPIGCARGNVTAAGPAPDAPVGAGASRCAAGCRADGARGPSAAARAGRGAAVAAGQVREGWLPLTGACGPGVRGRHGRKEGEQRGAGLSEGSSRCPRFSRGCPSAGGAGGRCRPAGSPVPLVGRADEPARRPPLPSAGPLTCRGPAGRPAQRDRARGSVAAPGPAGGARRKSLCGLRNRYLRVLEWPGRYRSPGAAFLCPGLARPGGSCHPSAPGGQAAPALERVAGPLEPRPSLPAREKRVNSALRPDSPACGTRTVLFVVVFLSPVWPCVSRPSSSGIL